MNRDEMANGGESAYLIVETKNVGVFMAKISFKPTRYSHSDVEDYTTDCGKMLHRYWITEYYL